MRRLVLLPLMGVLTLTACDDGFVRGSTSPPDRFPSIDRTLFGCPDLNGVYEWPGEVVDSARPAKADKGEQELTLHPFDLPNVEDAEAVSFDNSVGNSYYLVIARNEYAGEAGQRLLANGGSSEMGIGEYRCGFGWLEFQPEEITTSDGASLQLARTDDGGLIVGVHWANSEADLKNQYPEFHSPDGPARARVDTWRWHHLPRLGLRVDRDGRLSDEAREQ